MNGSELLKKLMGAENITQVELAKRAGLKRQSNVSELLRHDMRFSKFVSLVDALGYEIVIRRKK